MTPDQDNSTGPSSLSPWFATTMNGLLERYSLDGDEVWRQSGEHLWTLVITLVLGFFIFFVLWRYARRPSHIARWSLEEVEASATASEYADRLAGSAHAKRQLLTHSLLNDRYDVKFGNDEEVVVKRPKDFSRFKRFCYVLYNHGLHGIFKRNSHALPDLSTADAERGWLVYTFICDDSDCTELNDVLSLALNRYLVNTSASELTPKYMLEQSLYFSRICGYLHSRKVPLLAREFDWNDAAFVQRLCSFGRVLSPKQYRVTVDLAYPMAEGVLTLQLKIEVPIFQAGQKALLQYDYAKIGALQRLNDAKKRAKEQWRQLIDMSGSDDEAEETLDYETKQLLAQERMQRYKDNRNVTICISECLQQLPQMTIQQALVCSTLMLANAFVKRVRVKDGGKMDECTKLLKSLVLAMKLGLTPDVFGKNEGFEKFVTKNHLHRYLFIQKHELTVDADGVLYILRNGKLCAWKDIAASIRVDPANGTLLGQYSRHGLVEQGVYDWEVLEPFYVEQQLPPPWGNRYLFEFCSWIIDRPRMMGDHSYMRLKTPKGEWYSVGQYRPAKMGFHEQFVFPMKIKTSKFMSPDVSEYWNGSYTVLSMQITEEQFYKMKAQIEHDQVNGDHTYQLFHGNCTKYAKSIAAIAGIDLPSSIPILEALNWKHTPKWAKPFLKRCWAVMFNLFGLVFGSGMIDNELKNEAKFKDVRPFIKDLHDLTNPEKTITDHPFIIGHYVLKVVERWRTEHGEELRAKLEQLSLELQQLDAEPNTRSRSRDGRQAREEELRRAIQETQQELGDLPYALPERFRTHPDSPTREYDDEDPSQRIWEE
ncbi:hypothetical protein THASP1DRAFT_31126 [Thamnocephalis sphaerospora]|uniref:PPPDE domain-containing protein n=1 Tax=Thamnocephalis sphaerospora TaxID=78915 RepID=A0A4P9XMD2_9FUNG|nr:hypothetical protein THASP1DRAFT_31126 [Thamnocephalis sphaerospora]|eukprot:RKP07058.1 hypothetical protein THASP1DRAFT_31126 [Thamnocephalis sphaerospora]